MTTINLTRRRVLKGAAATTLAVASGAMTLGASRTAGARPMKTLRWGIVGTGGIANSMAGMIKMADASQIGAVSSRRMETARTFADRHEVPNAFDSWQAMMEAVQAFHDKHDFKNTGGEELNYRVALMAEELGEISSCVTKGKSTEALSEEIADLLILLMGTDIAAGFDLNEAFWAKMEKLMQRESRMVEGRIRVSEFRDMS